MRKHRLVIAFGSLALALASLGCEKTRSEPSPTEGAEPSKHAFGELSLDDLDARMRDAAAGKIKLAIFDNNHHERFDKGHIPGAKWVDFKDVKATDLPADKDATLVFYCSNEH
jgi:hypothetical protein